MGKKTLLLIIDNLVKGGAEVLLVGILPELNERFHVILVTLEEGLEFPEEEVLCAEKYCLGFNTRFSLLSGVLKLKKIIRKHSPDLIHSHLVYSSLITRMACPSNIPLLYSIHGELSKSDFNNSKILKFLEKITIRKNHFLMAVSNVVLKDYEKTISRKSESFVLHNYISDKFLNQKITPKTTIKTKPLRVVAVGNIKAAKNYAYLLNAFALLKDRPVSLDIYGNTNHPLYKELKKETDKQELKITFKEKINIGPDTLTEYDIFVMSSKNEGFGLAVPEAMSCGLPVILSDIPVMREITGNNALFFDLEEPASLARIIREIQEGKYSLQKLSEKGILISKQFCKKNYLKNLFKVYDQLLIIPSVK